MYKVSTIGPNSALFASGMHLQSFVEAEFSNYCPVAALISVGYVVKVKLRKDIFI